MVSAVASAPTTDGKAIPKSKMTKAQLKREKAKAKKNQPPTASTPSATANGYPSETDGGRNETESEMGESKSETESELESDNLNVRSPSRPLPAFERMTDVSVLDMRLEQTPSSSTVDLGMLDPNDPALAAFSDVFAHFQIPPAEGEGEVRLPPFLLPSFSPARVLIPLEPFPILNWP
jgi:hypothetical protein